MWRLEGYDAYSEEPYEIRGEWPTEEKTREAARDHLREIAFYQPEEMAGGQTDEGIQDRIFIIRPDGSKYRFLPVEAAA